MTETRPPFTERRFVVPLMLVTSLFFLWALGVNLNDILIPHLKKAFGLSDFQSSLIQTAFFGGYFLAALPAGWVMRKVGYKRGIIIGLVTCATGAFLFIPASYVRLYPFFLFALFVMACGQSFLEVGANPYVTTLGPEETAPWRLNTAQAFNSVGAVVTPVIGATFILSGIEYPPNVIATMPPDALEAWRVSEASAVRGPYLVITAIFLLMALLFAVSRLPEVRERADDGGARPVGVARAWRDPAAPPPRARRDRAVLLCGRAGGRRELRHPVRAAGAAGNAGEDRRGVPLLPPGRLHDRALPRGRRPQVREGAGDAGARSPPARSPPAASPSRRRERSPSG